MSGKSNGDAFEQLIRWQNERYKAKGIAVIEKQPTEFIPLRNPRGGIYGVKVENKATVDFIGRYYCEPIAIEAKTTEDNRIRLLEVENHQATFMDQWTSNGSAIGYVLVSFSFEEFYMVPWHVWSLCRKHWVNKKGSKAEPAYFPTADFTYNGMGSFHKDELPEAWKVKCNGQNGLPYLEVIHDARAE